MPDCIVIGCTTSTRRGRSNPNVSLHVFPKTHEKIRIWLKQTNQYKYDELEQMVQLIFDTNKTTRYRMCSVHFHHECYYTHGVNKKLMASAVPTIFPSIMSNSGTILPSSSQHTDVSEVVPEASTSSSINTFLIKTRPRIDICHACGHQRNITKSDTSTNTEIIITQDEYTQFNPYYGTLSASVQTAKNLGKHSKSTSSHDFVKKNEKYTLTMGDVSSETMIQDSTGFGTTQTSLNKAENRF